MTITAMMPKLQHHCFLPSVCTASGRGSAATQGFVLVTALVFLVVLSLLSVVALRSAMFGERMGANDQDRALARENAELALRDAELDIRGLRFDGVAYCAAAGAAQCGGQLRPAGSRPVSANDGFWSDGVNAIGNTLDAINALAGDSSTLGNAYLGMYSYSTATSCGLPIWSGANWNDNITRTCAGTIDAALPTVPYGQFTGAKLTDATLTPPRYLIEILTPSDLGLAQGSSTKMYFRITAVGFGRGTGVTGRTSVTLQSIFSPS